MNRFLTFFLVSFVLHIAVGAILLSQTGILGGKTFNKGISEVTEFPEEGIEDGNTEFPSETRSSESQKKEFKAKKPSQKKSAPEKNSSERGTKKPSQKKSKPEKSVKAPLKPVQKKLSPPVPKEKLDETSEKPVSAGNIPATKDIPKPLEDKKSQAVDEKATGQKEVHESPESLKSETEDEEIIKELKEEIGEEKTLDVEKPSEKVLPSPVAEDSRVSSSSGGGGKEPEQKTVSSRLPLDLRKARKYSQLRQMDGNPVPVYPNEALKKRWEGRVELVYYVNQAGFVEKIQLKQSSGYSLLDNSALRALGRYRYYPGQEGWVVHPVEFMLELEKETLEVAPLGTRAPGGF